MLASEIYGAQRGGQGPSWAVCVGLSLAESQQQPQNPHWTERETEAQKGEVPYSLSLSWRETELEWNPSESEAPHHTLLLKTAQRGCAEGQGGCGWAGDGLISFKHLPAVLEIPAPLWPNPFEGQI